MVCVGMMGGDSMRKCFVILMFCLSLAVTTMFLVGCDLTDKMVDQGELYALKGKTESTGSFFVGTGSISSRTYYYFLRELDGGMYLDQHPTKFCIVYEGEESPRYEKWNRNGCYWYYLYIPEGSVNFVFEVDLEQF